MDKDAMQWVWQQFAAKQRLGKLKENRPQVVRGQMNVGRSLWR
jgi:hypothetical protein